MSTDTKPRKARKVAPSSKINVSLPPAVYASLGKQGEPLNKSAGEFVQHFFEMCFSHPAGCHLKLENVGLVRAAEDVAQPMLPLGEQTTVIKS